MKPGHYWATAKVLDRIVQFSIYRMRNKWHLEWRFGDVWETEFHEGDDSEGLETLAGNVEFFVSVAGRSMGVRLMPGPKVVINPDYSWCDNWDYEGLVKVDADVTGGDYEWVR